MNKFISQKYQGFIVSNAAAFSIVGITKLLFKHRSDSQFAILVSSEFVITPLLMGIIAAWFWKSLELRSYRLTKYCLYNSVIAIALSGMLLHEGFICLIIVSPLICCFMLVGFIMGRKMFENNNQTLNMSIITLLVIIFIGDTLSKHEYENVVSDAIVINAPPDKVWNNVVAFAPIKQKPGYWLFNIGMPSPMATTVTGHYKGAGRKCIFSNGYVFGEKIVTYQPNNDLTFDIIDQPRDPEIMGHIDIERGQFLLKDNHNGTTTLIGNSWYKLYVFPTLYYDIWAKSITRNVHLRVMEHIKQLSENNKPI